MSRPDVSDITGDYLRRLDSAARVLPAQERRELVDSIAGHIDEARESGAVDSDADVRDLLDRLGDPQAIVASTANNNGWRPPPKPRTGLETVAILLMTVGSVVVGIGWLAGVVLMWSSARWTTREKVVGTVLLPGGFGVLLLAGLAPVSACSSGGSARVGDPVEHITTTCSGGIGLPTPVVLGLFAGWFIVSISVPIILLRRAYARAAAQ